MSCEFCYRQMELGSYEYLKYNEPIENRTKKQNCFYIFCTTCARAL